MASVCVVWYAFMIGLSILGHYVGYSRYTKKPPPRSPFLENAPGVSILRPLKGVDLELESNLRSSFEQNYPTFELIFSVASPNDPAVPVVERLMTEYKKIPSRLIVGDKQVGINPKVNNMVKSYEVAAHDILWILDSNVYVNQDTLGRSVDMLLEPGIGLVHHLPIAVQPQGYAAEVEQVFLDTNHAKMYLAINWVGIASCVMGKSNLYRRSDLDKAGGLGAFAKYMAEDNLVGEALWHQGLRHRMSADTACQALGKIRPLEYCRRRARWVRLRKYIVTAATLTEPFTESIVCGLLGALGFRVWWDLSMPLFFAVHWLAWFTNDYLLYRTLILASSTPVQQTQPMHFKRFICGWLSREISALPLYLYAMLGNEITWRDQRYRCVTSGTAVPVNDST
ncbi:glycosyltransferase family 21 protein [Phycomyces blakesleeanus NRRL 1555(-)]|uniref:Ceramide glucosyltransferase n=2 Tax=Phycomyces blakesleeanus TaxID=4837 RepID=A0A167L907_PHYB8|nr:glycosyltransferase family 21 protein [Phycomyces blakesleeanus NRRL 1555(-)]OAD69867.1 glycosyltransferase family 21 protein [Phycomyces blakesleeanus NRRL 1555(-)]|eukprot:XP_018287907.1 glycosyltransferase family 21 protein [Phycomyces blakesleeanus NRRL 1555(-)]